MYNPTVIWENKLHLYKEPQIILAIVNTFWLSFYLLTWPWLDTQCWFISRFHYNGQTGALVRIILGIKVRLHTNVSDCSKFTQQGVEWQINEEREWVSEQQSIFIIDQWLYIRRHRWRLGHLHQYPSSFTLYMES